ADRPEIDDDATALVAHSWDYRLRAEELMFEVHGHALVPQGLGDLIDRVAVVPGRIVDEHVKGAVALHQVADASHRRSHIAQVGTFETGTRRRGKRVRFSFEDVDEGDRGTLSGE